MISMSFNSKCTQKLIGQNSMQPEKGKLIGTIETFPINQEIKIDVKFPANLQKGQWKNIQHIADKDQQKKGNKINLQGNRLSAMWLNKNNNYIITDVNGTSSKPNSNLNSNQQLVADKWTTIISITNKTDQILSFKDEEETVLSDVQYMTITDDRKVWENVLVYLSDDFYNAAPVEVRNFQITDLDCEEKVTDWVAQCQQNRSTFLSQDNLPNCLVTADFGGTQECFKCESGYTYDADYQCITLAAAEEQGVCTSLTGKPAGTDECSYCDAGKGTSCEAGQALAADNSCVPAVANCDNYDCDGKCLECVNGQQLAFDANVCVQAIDRCVDYESSGACLNCMDSYVEVQDDLCCPAIQNCKVYADTCEGGCEQICDIGHIENENDVCVQEIPNCANYHDDGACDQCDPGYVVAVDDPHVCVSTGLPGSPQPCKEYFASGDCKTCVADQVLISSAIDSDLDKCVPIIDNCETYNQDSGECIKCVSTHQLAVDENVCVPAITHCETYHSSGNCFTCQSGYLKLSPTACEEDLPHCTSYGCNGSCEVCEYGYVELAGRCSPEVPYCAEQNPNGECKECTSGYSLSNSGCQDTKLCDSYNCEGTCVKCAEGHTLTEYGVCTGTSNQINTKK